MIPWVPDKGRRLVWEKARAWMALSERQGRFANGGPCVAALEVRLREVLGLGEGRALVVTCSGTAALHALVGAVRLVDGIERFASQAFTFPCGAQQALAGAALVDIDAGGGLDLDQIPPEVEAVVLTPCFGHLPDLDRYEAWAAATGRRLLLDAAAAPASPWRGRSALEVGSGAAVSLHHTKPLGFGEGGFLVVERRYEAAARACINFGLGEGDGPLVPQASNFKLSEVAAAFLLAWLEGFEAIAVHHRALHARFRREIASLSGVTLLPDGGGAPLASCLPVLFDTPVGLGPFLAHGVEARKYYRPLAPRPVAEDLYARIVCLPLHLDVGEAQIERYLELCEEVAARPRGPRLPGEG